MKNYKIHFQGTLGTSILLALVVIGLRPEPAAEAARTESADASKTTQQHLVETYGRLPLSFEANAGQTNRQVKFLSRGQGYTLFLTRRAEAVLVMSKSALKHTPLQPADMPLGVVMPQPEATSAAVLRMKLVGAERTPQIEGIEEFPGKANYFVGNEPSKWRTNVPTYAKVRYHAVYPGVDLVYYGNQRQLEQDFIVAPGADPGSITMAVEGTEGLSLDAQGDMVLAMKDGKVLFQKPVVYQELDEGGRREIPSSYRLKGRRQVGFQVAAYDGSRPLIIDPVLAYSTYLGGSGNDQGQGVAVDSGGNAYVTGQTGSTNFPTTTGAFQTVLAVSRDAFVTKLNPSGSGLVYSTYLGGTGGTAFQAGFAIAVDSSGNAYVTGDTDSSTFPTTSGAYQTTFNGGLADAFVTKLNSTGSGLVYSTYLGGVSYDTGFGIAVDASGNAYVAGTTGSTNFPTTSGAFQTTYGGLSPATFNAFVTKLNPIGSALVYSTYLGGLSARGLGIAVDSSQNAYVTGEAASNDFPTTAGAFQTTLGGGSDAFVTKLNPTGSGLLYSTYLGGSIGEQGQGIAVDSAGNAYVTGATNSTNFPTTTGAFQTNLTGFTNAFVTKLNSTGSALVYSTYFGGSVDEFGNGIAVDAAGNAYVTGQTFSPNLPTTSNAIQPAFGGGSDAFVTTLNPTGTGLVYSSYLGGSALDAAFGIALDPSFSAYVTGVTTSPNFPTTSNAFQTAPQGGNDGLVTKIANIACTPRPTEDDVEGDGHEKGNDGHDGKFHFCQRSREMEFEERDTGEKMKGSMDAVAVSGNQATISGAGTLHDGTHVHYTAVVLGNAPVIGTNHFAISWITATGSVFQTSGSVTNGYIVVHTP